MSTVTTLPRDIALCHLPHPFTLARGGVLEAPHVAFECFGKREGPVVAVLGGISAGRHVAAHAADPTPGFWDGLVGDGKAIDTRQFGVLSIDWLGGAGASSPVTTPLRIDVRDQAAALRHVCDALGIDRLHALVGGSYGGMVGLAFAARSPARVARLGVLAATARSRPSSTAWRVLQRRIVELGLAHGCAADALALARMLGLVTYRGRAELDTRFARATGDALAESGRWPIEDWLDAHGRRFVARFTPAAFLALSESIDACDLDARAIRTPTTVVGIRGDELVPADAVRALAGELRGPVEHVEFDSPYGHDAFLLEVERLTPIVRRLLATEGDR